eukprot:3932734-Rhodomonas_salina.1
MCPTLNGSEHSGQQRFLLEKVQYLGTARRSSCRWYHSSWRAIRPRIRPPSWSSVACRCSTSSEVDGDGGEGGADALRPSPPPPARGLLRPRARGALPRPAGSSAHYISSEHLSFVSKLARAYGIAPCSDFHNPIAHTPLMPPPLLKAVVAPPLLSECQANFFNTWAFSVFRSSTKHSLSPLRRQSSGMKHLPAAGATKPT